MQLKKTYAMVVIEVHGQLHAPFAVYNARADVRAALTQDASCSCWGIECAVVNRPRPVDGHERLAA